MLSVVLPAYNEERHLAASVKRLRLALGDMEHELIIVDDGSTDSTRLEALKLTDAVISFKKNQGKGSAIRSGMVAARGEAIAFLDSDSDISPDLGRFIEALKLADIAIASKRTKGSKFDASFERRFLSYGFNVFVRVATGLDISDTQTGLKVMRKEAVTKLLPLLSVRRFVFDVELLTAAKVLRMKVIELPVTVTLREPFSKRQAAWMATDVLRVAYRLRLIRYYHRLAELQDQGAKPEDS